MTHVLDRVTLGALVSVRDKMMAQQAAGHKLQTENKLTESIEVMQDLFK